MKRFGRKIRKIIVKGGLCWACSLQKCHMATFDNTCPCCRAKHGF